MSIYAAVIGTVAGICLGYAILYLFVGLRRREAQRLNLSFALFALGYAGTLLMGIWYRSQATVTDYLAISRWDGIFIWLAIVALNWYVAVYTGTRAKGYLYGLTAVFTIGILAAMLTPTLTFSEMPTLVMIPLPWNEEVPTLVGEENVWGALLLLGQLATLIFIVVAGMRQWRRGERQAALVLLGGMSWFIIALLYEILAEVGLWVFIPLAETGFLGIAVALSLQMANSVIKTEEALAASEKELSVKVAERTTELEEAQAQLIVQAQEKAVAGERSRLARELHDVVTQILFSINLIAVSLPRLWKRDPAMAESSTNELQRLTRGALSEMRILLRELRPQTIVATEMGTLLMQLSESISARHDILGDVQASQHCSLPPDVHMALYRIAQEAMNNITKHAEASRLSVHYTCLDTEVRLTISDDGHGFDMSEVSMQHMGLDIMQERAESIGADLTVESRPGSGTTIAAIWPISQRGESENE